MSEDTHTLDGLLEPGARSFDVATSQAISTKRIADALERIAVALSGDNDNMSWLQVIADRMPG